MIEALRKNPKIWEIYTREEEYSTNGLDQHDRFIYQKSKYHDVLNPIVSKFLLENGLKIEYPDGKKFAICLTHDIDAVFPSNLSTIHCSFRSLSTGQYMTAFKNSLSVINKKWNAWLNFGDIMKLEDKYGAKSSFYFITSDRNIEEVNYNIEELEEELGTIVDNGWEIGLHGGYYTYNDLNSMIDEKRRLEKLIGKKTIGYRNHYLRFKVPNTWELLSKAGFKYDTTLGYADYIGFRNGMCHPYIPFNLITNKKIDLLEIPLAVMDCTLFEYMKCNIQQAQEKMRLLIDIVEKYNGVLTILWHNTYMLDDYMKLYENILKYSYDKNAWITNAYDIWENAREYGNY
jgi:peptidoglycan/xylan/chitin deacetylase (PgdA/CDA1 family)